LLISLSNGWSPQTVVLRGKSEALGEWTDALRNVDPSILVIALPSELTDYR
jgi:hypothetical protein